jgi:hypothetical protein
MKSAAVQVLTIQFHKMDELIKKQQFKVEDAIKFQAYHFNVIRKLEDLEASRDNWKRKFIQLKKEVQTKNGKTR